MVSAQFADEKFELALDVHEQMQEFILNNGPKYILPFLNKSDKQKASQVCHGWNAMICSESIFKSIFSCVKDVAQTVRELEEKKMVA